MPDPTLEQLQQAAAYLEKSDKDLYEILSGDERERAFPEDLVTRGRAIYTNLKSNYQSPICESPHVRMVFADGPGNRRLLLVCAIADLIGGQGAFAVSALIVKEGLETFCAELWADRAP